MQFYTYVEHFVYYHSNSHVQFSDVVCCVNTEEDGVVVHIESIACENAIREGRWQPLKNQVGSTRILNYWSLDTHRR